MLSKVLVILLSVGILSACATSEESMMEEQGKYEREGISLSIPGVDGADLQGPSGGTQADLVVNVGDRVFFGYDRYDLTGEARMTLEKQARWLQQNPALNVSVEGHCDERGTREYNLALGERRANAAKNYLIALGVESSRITTISFGKERPAVPGSNDTAWSQNRRGVTKVE